MTRDETKMLMMFINAYYPRMKILDATTTVNVWYMELENYSLEDCEEAVREYDHTSDFHIEPGPGQIRQILVEKNLPDEYRMSDMEAWALVEKACSNSLYHSQEEYDKLPALIQKAVGTPSVLREIGSSDHGSKEFFRGQFIKSLHAVRERVLYERRSNPEYLLPKAEPKQLESPQEPPQLIERTDEQIENIHEMIESYKRKWSDERRRANQGN